MGFAHADLSTLDQTRVGKQSLPTLQKTKEGFEHPESGVRIDVVAERVEQLEDLH